MGIVSRSLFRQPAVITHRTRVANRYGGHTYEVGESVPVWAVLAPAHSADDSPDTIPAKIYLDPGVPIGRWDLVQVAGETWTLEDTPTGWPLGTEAVLTRWEGDRE